MSELPVKLPVTLPVTFPVTLPVILPVTFPVRLPVTLPVSGPLKDVAATDLLKLHLVPECKYCNFASAPATVIPASLDSLELVELAARVSVLSTKSVFVSLIVSIVPDTCRLPVIINGPDIVPNVVMLLDPAQVDSAVFSTLLSDKSLLTSA